MCDDLIRLRLLENVFDRVTEFARTVHSILPTVRDSVELHEKLLESIVRILALLRMIRDGLIGRAAVPGPSRGDRSKG